ncbi:MAG: GspE/PulE family protein, partial [Patescibacteria group bacterium]
MAVFDEEKSDRRLNLLRRKDTEASTRLLAQKYGIPYADLGVLPVEIDAIAIVPEQEARSAEAAVFQVIGSRLKIAVRNPDKAETKALLERLGRVPYACDVFLASGLGLEHAWEFYKKVPEAHEASAGAIALSPAHLSAIQKEISSLPDIARQIKERAFKKTSDTLEVILAGALATDASDVHIEPQEHTVRLRMRLDGTLHDIAELPPKLFALLLSRIKLVSELKLNIHDRAQDGRFTIGLDHAAIEVRTSTLPGPYGENVVLRILNPKTIEITLHDLGMSPWVTEAMEKELKKPNGLILTTGPTGSGKTTTLYTFLRAIHNPGIKIITIEDPIEYHLTGIEQTQVDTEKGYDFANGLRAIVRQDPDAILVGEIRDLETAETAMHASLTGHLVFSTLHTNNAAGTIPRLIDLGVRPSIIAPAINVAMAQRLVRKLCPSCRTPVSAYEADMANIKKELADFSKDIPIPPENEWHIFRPAEKGCPACNGIGYKGRTGLYEIILVNDRVEALILASAPESDIKKEA